MIAPTYPTGELVAVGDIFTISDQSLLRCGYGGELEVAQIVRQAACYNEARPAYVQSSHRTLPERSYDPVIIWPADMTLVRRGS